MKTPTPKTNALFANYATEADGYGGYGINCTPSTAERFFKEIAEMESQAIQLRSLCAKMSEVVTHAQQVQVTVLGQPSAELLAMLQEWHQIKGDGRTGLIQNIESCPTCEGTGVLSWGEAKNDSVPYSRCDGRGVIESDTEQGSLKTTEDQNEWRGAEL